MSLFVSNIDDLVADCARFGAGLKGDLGDSDKTAAAKKVGAALAKAAIAQGIETVVFDRNGFDYHGRVEAVAAAAREAGLKF